MSIEIKVIFFIGLIALIVYGIKKSIKAHQLDVFGYSMSHYVMMDIAFENGLIDNETKNIQLDNLIGIRQLNYKFWKNRSGYFKDKELYMKSLEIRAAVDKVFEAESELGYRGSIYIDFIFDFLAASLQFLKIEVKDQNETNNHSFEICIDNPSNEEKQAIECLILLLKGKAKWNCGLSINACFESEHAKYIAKTTIDSFIAKINNNVLPSEKTKANLNERTPNNDYKITPLNLFRYAVLSETLPKIISLIDNNPMPAVKVEMKNFGDIGIWAINDCAGEFKGIKRDGPNSTEDTQSKDMQFEFSFQSVNLRQKFIDELEEIFNDHNKRLKDLEESEKAS